MPSISRGHIINWLKRVNRYGQHIKIGSIVLDIDESRDLLLLALRGINIGEP